MMNGYFLNRRRFITKAGYVTAGFFGLRRALSEAAVRPQEYRSEIGAAGKLLEDPKRILDLPEGFSYSILSKTGDVMSDGFRTPGAPDGMAAFPGNDGKVVLVRNHELTDAQTFEGAFGITNELIDRLPSDKLFDTGGGKRPQLGGTSNLVYNPETRTLESSFLSLAGTIRNCAGGPTPWNSWITCEETVESAGEFRDHPHGYNFEVPACSEIGLVDPVPLKAMGRFNHEAVAVDPSTGIVYQTEDENDGLIYRFIPNVPGNLAAGGRLEALVIKETSSCDTRNWPDTGKPKFPIGKHVAVEWMPIDDPENPTDKMREVMHKAGAACFARGEGMWYGSGQVYFACTNGGIAKSGQIFLYRPSLFEGTPREKDQPGSLALYLEPNDTQLLEYGDNLTIAPWGDLIICEDGANTQYLRGITPEGKVYTLARNSYFGNSELAGACFAPNHPTLFLNVQWPGITLAITGPWESLHKAATS